MQADTTSAPISELGSASGFSLTGALSALTDKLSGWLDALILALPNLVVAVLVVIAAVFVARGARRLVIRALSSLTDHAEQATNVVRLLGTISYVAVLAAGTFIALGILDLDGVVTSLLAGAGIVGLALGFAFQDIASNFIAGVLMAVRVPFTIGQIIESNDYMGTVRGITLRSTEIETFQGQRVIIPNADVYQNPIINYSVRGERRIDLGCGVGYGDDLEHAEQIAVKAIEDLEMRKTDRAPAFFYTEFGGSSVNFVISFWVDFRSQADFLAAQSAAVKALKSAFDANGVTIPFPIRTLDFGPNGGVPLTEMLSENGKKNAEP